MAFYGMHIFSNQAQRINGVKRRTLSKSLLASVTANENKLFTSAYRSKAGLQCIILRAGVRIPQRQRCRRSLNQPRLTMWYS